MEKKKAFEIIVGNIKKSDSDMSIDLKRTTDILKWLGSHKKKGQVMVVTVQYGFLPHTVFDICG